MTTIGRIEPFEEQEGTWDQYQERLEQYFIANDVADDKRGKKFILDPPDFKRIYIYLSK